MARKTIFQYGLVDGKPAITGEGGASIFDADQNNFIRQEGFQDVILAEIREKVGIPSGLSALWTSADPAKILPAIANLEDPRHMMLALRDVSSYLPEGMKPLLDKVGAGTPELRTALQSALRNPVFQKQLFTQTGSDQLAKSMNVLQRSEETLKAQFGLDDAGIKAIISKVGTDIFARIGKGEFNGKFDQLETAVQQSAIMTATTTKLDMIAEANPQLSKVIGVIKSDPDLMFSIGRAALLDKSVTSGFEAMLKGEAGIDMANLAKMLTDPAKGPTARKLLKDMLDVVADKEEITFSSIVDFAQKMEKGDIAGASNVIKGMGMEVPPELAMAQQFDQFKGQIAAFGQTSFGAKILNFLKEALGPNGFLGQLLNTLGMGGLATSLRGMFEAPVTTAATAGPDGKVTNLSAEEFKAKFKEAMEGRDLGRRYDNPEHVRAALIESGVDPKLADEMAAIKSDVTLNRDFSQAVTNAGSLDAVADAVTRLHQDLKGGGTLKHAVGTMAPAVG